MQRPILLRSSLFSAAPLLLVLSNLVALGFGFSSSGCGTTTFPALDPNVQLTNGRFATNTSDGSVRFDWTGATIAVMVTGTTSVAMNLTGSSQWTVLVDGAVSGVVQSAAPQPQPVALVSGLSEAGTHTISIVKMAEALCGAVTFTGVTLDAGGKLLSSPRKTRRMVFLGDSITCGYGALGQMPCPGYSCGASADAPKAQANWESGYASYGALLGRQFEADTQIVCVSGAGFAHKWNQPGVAPTDGGMTEKFGQVLGSGGAVSSNAINTSAFVPDAVIINIGTNDVGIPHGNVSSIWVETYVDFLRKCVRGHTARHLRRKST